MKIVKGSGWGGALSMLPPSCPRIPLMQPTSDMAGHGEVSMPAAGKLWPISSFHCPATDLLSKPAPMPGPGKTTRIEVGLDRAEDLGRWMQESRGSPPLPPWLHPSPFGRSDDLP